jgi:Arc/MetJ-type ribon-helix-helix transcriptional regulator
MELEREALRDMLEQTAMDARSDQARVSAIRLLLQMQREDIEAVEPKVESVFEGLHAVAQSRRAS